MTLDSDSQSKSADSRFRLCRQCVEEEVLSKLDEIVDAPDVSRSGVRGSEWHTMQFERLGLSSLDWMSLATIIERRTGTELPDRVLTDRESRCVDGWAAALYEGGAFLDV